MQKLILPGMSERGAVELAGSHFEQVSQDQANGSTDAGACPVARPDRIERRDHADLAADRAVDDHQDPAATGTRRGAVQFERLGEHRGHRRHHDREVHRQAPGHHCIDRDLLCGDRPLPDRFDADQMVRSEERPFETCRHRLGGRRDDGEPIGPALGMEMLLQRPLIVEADALGVERRGFDHGARSSPTKPFVLLVPGRPSVVPCLEKVLGTNARSRAVPLPGMSPDAIAELELLRRTRDFMDRHYAQTLSVPELAQRASMSAAHFSRRFHATYGETPYSYLMTRRIERSMALLRQGVSVTDACVAVGCASLGSFSSRFTEVVGVTPSEYRRRDHRSFDVIPPCVSKVRTRPRRTSVDS